MKKKIYTYDCGGRTFEGWASSFEPIGTTFSVCVWVHEVIRPNWKFFRTRMIDYHTFWLCDYPTAEDGIKNAILRVVNDLLESEQERAKVKAYLGEQNSPKKK